MPGDVGVHEKDKLHLEKRLGDIMDSTGPAKGKDERKPPHQSITFNSPCDNRFVSGDYIEVHIHSNDRVEGNRETPDRGASARSEEQSVKIQDLVASAVEAVANIREQ